MIDEAVRPELEALLRATLAEMIPKLVQERADDAPTPTADLIIVRRAAGRRRRSAPRFAVAGLVAAAAVVGLVAVATRDAERSTSTDGRSPGQPEAATPPTPTVVPTTTGTELAADEDGTYYSTISPMLVWPQLATSKDGASTDGYGMTLCSGGSWTKFTSVVSVDRERQTYQGTLCTFTNFNQRLAPAIASCSSMSAGTNYARCEQQPASTVGSPPTESVAGSVFDNDVLSHANVELLPATPPDAPQVFGDQLSAAVPSSQAATFSDGSIQVLLSTGRSPGETCFTLRSSYWSSNGCLDTTLLSTGLAYAAFVDGDGPIEMVGIVPDDVATVEIAGQVIEVKDNAWIYSAQPGDDLRFTVFSADRSVSASVG